MSLRVAAVVGLLLLCRPVAAGEPSERFTLKSGDRVVLLGGGIIEQECAHGYLETLLVSRHPDADIVVRNLGWGGDTVRGIARTGGYQNPDGLARLLKEVQDLKPTVLVLGYGMNESFDGAAGLAGFIVDYEQLLTKLAPLKARIVLLSPTYHEDLGRPLPDPTGHNRDLEEYTAALKKLAGRRGFAFVDLFDALRVANQEDPGRRLTTNGIQLTGAGYAVAARAVALQLRLPAHPWQLEIDHTGQVRMAQGTKIDKVAAAAGTLRFLAIDAALSDEGQRLRVAGLPPGTYTLTIDGEAVLTAAAADWRKGPTIATGPAFRDFDKLRAAIVRKNELFYRRWRPFNDHGRHWGFMQGDFALYDKEIAAQERLIGEAHRPRPHLYAIAAKGDMK